MMTVDAVLADARSRLSAAGCASAALDARLLLTAATGLSTTCLIANSRQPIGGPEIVAFAAMLDRRVLGEPVARIVSEKEFWSLPIGLNAATLVPRPETEILVETALCTLSAFQVGPDIHICDLGTGSGAILIALLTELPRARATAVDISAEALAQAKLNAERHGLAGRICFHKCDFSNAPAGSYDLVVSNPPYVRSTDVARLGREVCQFDPLPALDGGADGLDGYRAIARRLPDLLAPEGLAVLELGAGQAEAVRVVLEAEDMQICDIRSDLAGVPRALVARRIAGAEAPRQGAAKKDLEKRDDKATLQERTGA